IQAGAYQLAIGAGVESMSQAPLPPSFKPGAPLGAQYSPRELARYQGNPLIPQGVSSELMNKRFGLTREALDAFAVRSHRRAIEASRAGRVQDQLVRLHEDPTDPDSPL
ncbi:steroid 3-ketoacyl-CoA thiolase, partial [Pseudomonas paraeruginosa]